MNIIYVRHIFPKITETFISEEVIQLTRAGTDLRIHSEWGEFAELHDNFISGRLAGKVWYERRKLNPKNMRILLTRVAAIATSWGKLTFYLRNLMTGKIEPHEATHRSAESQIGLRSFLHRLRGLSDVLFQSIFIGNLSVAINQERLAGESFRPDLIHCPFTFRWDTLKVRELQRRYPGVPVSVALRAQDLYCSWQSLSYAREKRELVAGSRWIVTSSEFNRTAIERMTGRKDAVVIHDMVDFEFFREEARPPRAECSIVCVARFFPKKGIEYLIGALAMIAREAGIIIRCEIIGEGPLRTHYEEMIRLHGLTEAIVVRGPLDRKAIRASLRDAGIFVLPCVVAENGDTDILPNSIKEAMGMRLAVITTKISGIDELIEDAVDGRLVPPRSVRGLAAVILELYSNGERRRRIGDQAREKVIRYFGFEREVAAWKSLLSQTPSAGAASAIQ